MTSTQKQDWKHYQNLKEKLKGWKFEHCWMTNQTCSFKDKPLNKPLDFGLEDYLEINFRSEKYPGIRVTGSLQQDSGPKYWNFSFLGVVSQFLVLERHCNYMNTDTKCIKFFRMLNSFVDEFNEVRLVLTKESKSEKI